MVNWIFYIRSMEFIYNDEFSNGVIIEDNGDGFAVAIESKVGVEGGRREGRREAEMEEYRRGVEM